MSSLAQDLAGITRQGLTWWTSELKSLVPKRLREAMQPARPNLVVELRDGHFSLVRDPLVPASTQASAGLLSEQALLDWLGRRDRLGSQASAIQLRLPHSACLVRRIELPDRARADASRILELDLERSTPLDAAEIYTAFYEDPVRPAKGVTGFVQLIVKKSTVDTAVARLEAAGVLVQAVDCCSDDGKRALPVNFLKRAGSGNTGEKARPIVAILAGLALLMVASSAWISISQLQTALTEIEGQTDKARTGIAKIANGRSLSDSVSEEAVSVAVLKASRPSVVQILNELTRLLPDTASLTEFSVEGTDVTISGFSKSASEIVPLLERSQLFTGVSLSAPITFDDGRNKERFSYKLRLRTAKADAVPAPADDAGPLLPEDALP